MAVVLLFILTKNDLRTTTGIDCRLIENVVIKLSILHPEGNVLEINISDFNQNHRFAETSPEETYRFQVLDDLLSLRSQFAYFEDDMFSTNDVNSMVDYICTS